MKRYDILRRIHLQVKSGIFPKHPLAYQIMRKVPGITYNSVDATVKTKVPYAHLLEKAYEKNPLLRDESIFPGYAHLEPRALILAKKQYFYMQQGLSEEDAYQKAVKFVDEMEDEVLTDLKEIEKEVKSMGASAPFLSDPDVAQELAKWQAILRNITYEDLSLVDQGKLDRFVQTKILKWSEVERERRMKDIILYKQFEKVVAALFPIDPSIAQAKRDEFQRNFGEKFFAFHGYKINGLETQRDFLMEDYFQYFEKVKSKPDAEDWNDDEYEEFQQWLLETLAFPTALEHEKEDYINDIFDQFFPMLMLPSRANVLTLPKIDEVRGLLYENQIGYKQVDGKLFVKRFYKLPNLLFPTDVFCAKIARNPAMFLRVTVDDDALLSEMRVAGLSESKKDEIKLILKDNRKFILKQYQKWNNEVESAIINAQIASRDSVDSSVLDEMLSGNSDKEENFETSDGRHLRQVASFASPKPVSDDEIDDSDLDPEAADFVKKLFKNPALLKKLSDLDDWSDESVRQTFSDFMTEDESRRPLDRERQPTALETELRKLFGPLDVGATKGSKEWDSVFKNYFPEPQTELEKRRNAFFTQMDHTGDTPSDLTTEAQLKDYKKTRLEVEMMVRARLAVIYEKKEAARRVEDTSQRTIPADEFPTLPMPIDE